MDDEERSVTRFLRDIAEPSANERHLEQTTYRHLLRCATMLGGLAPPNLDTFLDFAALRGMLSPRTLVAYASRVKEALLRACTASPPLSERMRSRVLDALNGHQLLLLSDTFTGDENERADESFVARFACESPVNWLLLVRLVLSSDDSHGAHESLGARCVFYYMKFMSSVGLLYGLERRAFDELANDGYVEMSSLSGAIDRTLLLTSAPSEMFAASDDDDQRLDIKVLCSRWRANEHDSSESLCSACAAIVLPDDRQELISVHEVTTMAELIYGYTLSAENWCRMCELVPLFNVCVLDE